jgi:hypothetical protein
MLRGMTITAIITILITIAILWNIVGLREKESTGNRRLFAF